MSSPFDPIDEYFIRFVGLSQFVPTNHFSFHIINLIWDGLVLGMNVQTREIMTNEERYEWFCREGECYNERFVIDYIEPDILLFSDICDILGAI